MPTRLIAALCSVRLTLGLLLALAVLAMLGALPREPPTKGAILNPVTAVERFLGVRETFRSPVFIVAVSLLTMNVLFCTAQRFRRAGRIRPRLLTDLLMHLALVLVMAGGAVKAGFAVVRTVTVPAGTETSSAYDWQVAADVPLGYRLRVEELETRYYPLRARIGLTDQRTKSKIGVVEVTEGTRGGASRGGVVVELLDVDREQGRASLRVRTTAAEERILLGLAAGPAASTEAGGVGFTLIAYRDEVRMVRALVNIVQASGLVSERWLAPNESFGVEGTHIYLTAWGKDQFGNPFAGLQISRDPGAPLFWAGSILLALALPLHLLLKRRQSPSALPLADSARR